MATARQDLRRFILAPETTLGTYTATNGVILPVAAGYTFNDEVESVDLSGAADGYVGGLPAVRTRIKRTGEITTHIYDYITDAFPPWLLVLLASGWQATYDTGVYTIVPSNKPITAWPGGTAGTRAPIAVSLTEILLDNATADRKRKSVSTTFATKLRFMRGEPMALVSSLLGLVPTSSADDYTDTDASDIGAISGNQGTQPVPWAPSSLSVTWDHDTGTSAAELVGFDGFELDLAPTHDLLPGAVNGYAMGQPVFASAGSLTLTSALTRGDDFAVPDRARASIDFTVTFGSGATLQVEIPFAQFLTRTNNNDGGRLMAEYSCRVSRGTFGDSTPPVTITYTPAT